MVSGSILYLMVDLLSLLIMVVQRPQYVTDAEGNEDITQLDLANLPGWDSYQDQ